jgi:uncharacterized protein YutE (UPF0331/DUF86 family)
LIDKDIVFEKISKIKKCLNRINEVTQLNPDKLDDINVQEIFILNLQRSIQSCIDIATHVISAEGWGLPKFLREYFEILTEKKIISRVLGQNLKNMVSFRNIAVHDYRSIDENILKSILSKNLKDIEDFYMLILKKYQL